MRIAVDIRTLTDGKSGIETSGIQVAVIEMLNQLQRIDTDNEYLLFETRKSSYEIFNGRWKKVLLPSFSLPSTVWTQSVFPWYLARYCADVLWAPKYLCPLWFFRKIRVYTTIHDLTFLHFPETLPIKDRIQCALLLPFSAKRSTAVLTVSESIKKDIENNYKVIRRPVVAIPHGHPLWATPPLYSREGRKNFLFFAGNLEPRKNLTNVVKALEILYAEGLTIELHMTSPASWKFRKIIDYIERSPVKSSIKMLGFLPRNELKKKYLLCKALLYPSFYEGFGLPVLEALAMDCLVITSRGTVMQEIAGKSAMYFDPFDPCDIADKIRTVYSKSFDGECYLRNKNSVLEKYSWDASARKMLSIMNSKEKPR